MDVIEQKIRELPRDMQQEVMDFIDFLLTRTKKGNKRRKRLKLDWMGGLKEYRDLYTSLDLQKKALEWRD